MIDPDGFRPNVAMVILNDDSQVFWAQRCSNDGWQFPQGGMRSDETPVEAMYRELREEVGLLPEHVDMLGSTRRWLRYRLPRRYQRHYSKPLCIGQKQVWFMLRLLCEDREVCLDRTSNPEFDHWRWVDYWHPLDEVVAFKRSVYRKALQELAPLMFPDADAIGRPGGQGADGQKARVLSAGVHDPDLPALLIDGHIGQLFAVR